MTKQLLTFALLAASISFLPAAVIPIINPSFESPVLSEAGQLLFTNQVPGWTGSGGSVLARPTTASFNSANPLPSPADGNQAVYLNGGAGTFIYQNVGALLANTTYTLTFALGRNLDGANTWSDATSMLLNGTNQNGTVLASLFPAGPTAGTFTTISYTYTSGATVSGDLVIFFGGSGGNQIPFFDNVQLTTSAIPEPSVGAMMLGGLGMLLLIQRKRRAAQG